MSWVLQAGWVLDPLPQDFPIWLIALGLEAMFVGVVVKMTKQTGLWNGLTKGQRLFGVFGLGLGYFFSALAVLSVSYNLYAAYLFLVFRTLEGGATVQIYQRTVEFLKTGKISSNISGMARHLLVMFFVGSLGLYLFIKVLTSGPIFRTFWTDLSLIYTMSISILTFIAVRWRLRDVKGDYNVAIISGLALGIAGAQVYGFTIGADILVFLGGTIAYSIGFWIAAGILIAD